MAFWDRVITLDKGSSTPTKMSQINSRQTQGNVEKFDEIHALSTSDEGYIKEIYPSQLPVEKANKSVHLADYKGLLKPISGCK